MGAFKWQKNIYNYYIKKISNVNKNIKIILVCVLHYGVSIDKSLYNNNKFKYNEASKNKNISLLKC